MTHGPDPSRPLADLFGRRVAPGALLAGCRIERELGRGAMGVVYLARDPSGAPVAVKALLALDPSPERLARLRREAEVAAGLDHPGIVRVLGHDVTGSAPCLVLEYVAGRDLARVLEEDDPPLARRLELVEQVARAVAHAHERGVIHRDLKPANVLVDGAGRCKVADFGLCRDLDRRTRLTVTGQELGTPAYMAPEQVQGRTDVGPPADVHALGVVLFEVLTGRLPWSASTPMALLDQVLRAPPPRLSSQAAGLPRELERIVSRALAKEPAARPTALELARDLAAVRRNPRAASGSGLPRAIAIVVIAVAAVALVGLALRPTTAPPAGSPTSPAPPPVAPPVEPAPASPSPAEQLGAASEALRAGQEAEAERLARSAEGEAGRALLEAIATYRADLARGEEALARLEGLEAGGAAEAAAAIEAATSAAREARARAPRAAAPLWLLARARDAGLEYDEAEDALADLVLRADLPPDLAARAWCLRALVAQARAEPDLAERALDEASRADPGAPTPHAVRGSWRMLHAFDLAAATPHLERAFELAPGRYEGAFSRALLLTRRLMTVPEAERAPLHAAAIEACRTAQGLAPRDDGRAWDLEGRVHALCGFGPTAEQAWGAAIAGHARSPGRIGHALRALVADRKAIENERKVERAAHADRVYRRLHAERPGHPIVLAEAAIIHHVTAGRLTREVAERLLGYYSAAVKANPAWWEAHFYLGHLVLRSAPATGSVEDARAEFEVAIQLRPGHAWCHAGRARCLLLLGRLAEAEQDARRATELAPTFREFGALLEETLRAQGK